MRLICTQRVLVTKTYTCGLYNLYSPRCVLLRFAHVATAERSYPAHYLSSSQHGRGMLPCPCVVMKRVGGDSPLVNHGPQVLKGV